MAAARARGRNDGRPYKMALSKLRLAVASMNQPETTIGDLWAEPGITLRTGRSIRPTRARRPFDASVDPTEARNSRIINCRLKACGAVCLSSLQSTNTAVERRSTLRPITPTGAGITCESGSDSLVCPCYSSALGKKMRAVT
jgi:hypothetical protein